MPSVEELERQLAEARAAEVKQIVSNSVPQHGESDPYAVTAWGQTEYDFVTPSGQRCRLRKLDPAELAEAGILDKVTRLPGVTAGLVEKSSGQPPAPEPDPEAMPDKETIRALVDLVNVLVPMVVVKPSVAPIPENDEERVQGVVYVDSIEITDRIAIMERSLQGLAKLDSFRKQS